MSDNILTTDRNSANIALAAKDVAGVLVPRNMLTDAAGADIDPATAGKQDTANTSLAALELALADPATETTLAAVKTAAEAIAVDPPTQTTLAAVKPATEALAVDPPTETTLAAMSAKLPASPGPKAGSASLSVVEALPTTTNFSVQTSATGSSFVALASAACNVVRIINAWPGAADIEVRRGGAGVTIPVPGGAERAFDGLTNANELDVRRIDQSNTQVTISCEKVVL